MTKNPILTELERIQHDLSFNIITPEEAIERIEIVVDGLKLKQLFRKEISAILNQMHLLAISFEEMKKNLPHINSRVTELVGHSYEEINQDPVISGLLRNILSGQTKVESIIKEINSSKQRISKKLSSIHYFIKDTTEYDELINNIDDILTKADSSVKDFDLELKQTRLEFSNRKNNHFA